jgi:hypothetical protein
MLCLIQYAAKNDDDDQSLNKCQHNDSQLEGKSTANCQNATSV